MKLFNSLTKKDVEYLRRQYPSVAYPGHSVSYGVTKSDVDAAVKHLKTLYTGNVTVAFASKILLLNEIY